MKRKIILLLLSFVFVCGARAESIPLDGKWSFRTDPYNAGTEQQWYLPAHDVSGWDSMDVPGNWNTRLEYADYTGAAWYRISFDADPAPDHDLILFFESVYFDADVWLNGEKIGSHDFGFTGFGFDVTRIIRPGVQNILVVRVDNSYKIGATWNWGGIRRSVVLQKLPAERIERIFVTATPDLDKGYADIFIRTELHIASAGNLNIEIIGPDSAVVARANKKINAGCSETTIPVRIKKARLWNFDTPDMYTVKASFDNGNRRHALTEHFGIRKIEIDGYRLLVNGIPVRLNGANWVADERFTGNTLPSDIFMRDIDMMKECGVHMARLSHHALPRDVLDYIDRKGMLIVEEIPLWNKNKYVTSDSPVPLRWIGEVIGERYNHPCIIGWSAGNEIGRLSDNPDLEGYLSGALARIRSLDSTRLAVYVTHTLLVQPWEPVMLSDMIFYNQYGAHGERADKVHERYPGKPLFYAEYGRQVNSADPNNRMTDYEGLMADMSGRDFLIGGSVWTFNDYRTNYRDQSTDAMGNRPWGVVDVYRRKKRGFEKFQRINSPLRVFDLRVDVDGEKIFTRFRLEPRGLSDIPSFDLKGYRLRVEYLDRDGIPTAEDVLELPLIAPGGTAGDYVMNGDYNDRIHSVSAALVSPVGYAVEKRRYFLQPPSEPSVAYHDCSDKEIRIYFDRKPCATEWYVEYTDGKTAVKTEKTINDHITLEGLDFGKPYSITLIAVNDAGEIRSSRPLIVSTTAGELPPAIYHLAMRGENLEVGFESSNADMGYEFMYSLSPDFGASKKIFVTESGAVNLPLIEQRCTHYIKIRKRLRYGYESPWSRIYVAENAK